MAIVYKITNKTNGKSYIGYTTRTLNQRWDAHKSSTRQGSKFRFHSAIRKYGIDDWVFETLFESDSVDLCKNKEEQFISEMNLTNNQFGYNAKPGGCGGWIVPNAKYNVWLEKNTQRSIGITNSNSTGYTNDELIDIALNVFSDLGRIVGHRTLVEECKKRDIRFPKSFRPFRFDGKYENMIKIIEEKTGMVYNPMFRSEDQREKLRQANIGKNSSNKNTKVIIVEGRRKHVTY
jgi:predicted GIY-YIG superfamily endonuclease